MTIVQKRKLKTFRAFVNIQCHFS